MPKVAMSLSRPRHCWKENMDWLASMRTVTPEATILLRLLLAATLGAIIGLDREYKDRPAGLRTHMLTALAAAAFTIITIELVHEMQSLAASAQADPTRVIEAVTAGVAFLAAGAIIQARGRVEGLTTGAAMWLAGAIGVASGAGYYSVALMATALAVSILTVLALLERHMAKERSAMETQRAKGSPHAQA